MSLSGIDCKFIKRGSKWQIDVPGIPGSVPDFTIRPCGVDFEVDYFEQHYGWVSIQDTSFSKREDVLLDTELSQVSQSAKGF
jgi:hypothetical protein